MADTRKDKRSPVALKVRFKSATVDEFIEQYSTDVSRGGIFVKSGRPMKVGTLLKFQFQLKDESTLIRGVGRVVWTREDDNDPEAPPGMGIKFIKMDDKSREVLDRVLSSAEPTSSRFEAGPGAGKGESEAADAHPSDPPQGGFFPSTSSESDLPPHEDRTAVRHASEFLAGALSGVEDETAAREAEESAEQARKRSEEIDKQRAAAAEKSAEPSILVDPSLGSERPAPPEGDQAQEGEAQSTDGVAEAQEKAPDPERFIDTEVGSREQLDRLAAERAAAKEAKAEEKDAAQSEESEADGESEVVAGAEKAEETQADGEPAAAGVAVEAEQKAQEPARDSSAPASGPAAAAASEPPASKRGLWIALAVAAVAALAYAVTSGGGEPSTSPAETTEPAAEPTEPASAEPEDEAVGLAAEQAQAEAGTKADGGTADAAVADAAGAATGGDAEADAEPPADAPQIKLRILSVPAGADIEVDGEALGKAPLTAELTVGVPVEVRAKMPGRAEVVREIEPREDALHRLRMVMPRLHYVLKIVSEPPGATAIVGAKRVETPGELDVGIPPRGHVTVFVRKQGYVQARRAVLVGEFEERDGAMRETLEVELTEKPARAAPAPAQPSPTPAAPKKPAKAPTSTAGTGTGDEGDGHAPAKPPKKPAAETDAPASEAKGSEPKAGSGDEPAPAQPTEPADEPAPSDGTAPTAPADEPAQPAPADQPGQPAPEE